MVNQAVGDSKWFSILEYDDEYTPIWFDNFKKYVDFYSDISVFMPLEDLIDATDNKFGGIGMKHLGLVHSLMKLDILIMIA